MNTPGNGRASHGSGAGEPEEDAGDAFAGFDAVDLEPVELEAQINIPPSGSRRLWKTISTALRCPICGSTQHKAETGKRHNAEGLLEQYRRCDRCNIRFRAVYE